MKEMLKKELEDELKELNKLRPGTDEYKIAMDGIMKLSAHILDIEKHEQSILDRDEDRKLEREKMSANAINERYKNASTLISILANVLVTGVGTAVVLNFEKTGSICSNIGRQIINRIVKK